MADDQHHQPDFYTAPRVPIVSNPAAAEVFYFDGPLAFNFVAGMGSITLTATRQLIDTDGQAYEDRVVTGILKGPIEAFHQLHAVLNELERRVVTAAAAAEALATKPEGEATH